MSGSNVVVRAASADATVKVSGRLAESYVPELETCWRSARTEHPGGKILVDLQHVTFIDSTGLGALIAVYNYAGDQHRVLIQNPRRNVQRILEITGLGEVLWPRPGEAL